MTHICHSVDVIDTTCHCGTPFRTTLYCCGDQDSVECEACEEITREKRQEELLLRAQERDQRFRKNNWERREHVRTLVTGYLERKRKET